MQRSTETGRNSTANIFTNYSFARFARRLSAAIIAIMHFPAFLASCTEENFVVRIDKAPRQCYWFTDVFVFCGEAPYLLDSYQQFPAGETPVYVSSGPGEKRIVALPAKEGDLYSRAYVQRYQDLGRESLSLLDDSPSAPFFWGTATVGEGSSRTAVLEVSQVISSIRVRSVSCNFSGRPYEDKLFHNDRLFFINVVSEFCPLAAEGGRPVSWLNYGALTDEHPYITADGWGDTGPGRIYPKVTLYCYPNPKGSPPTRLVLEGSIGDARCYYPIDIDVPRGGIRMNLDITLHRMGTQDPDAPASPDTYSIEYSTVPWNEKEPVTEDF